MSLRPISFLGVMLLILVTWEPALAFSTDSDNEDATRHSDADQPPSQGAGDYHYSGLGFIFSISRTAPSPDAASARRDPDAERDTAARSRPGFFRRAFDRIFGDD
ncbi:MAG: hypothetical protein P4M00_18170 [Azospirillaceae bacterium]|nr:hypothetical protein [Azospirillaceae bacterium]